MTERSYYWDGLVTGDAVLAPYPTTTWNDLIWKVLFQRDSSEQSIIDDYLNELQVTGVSGGAKVATGAALVNGTLYENTVAVSKSIDTPASNPRIDRIVLRKTWVDQQIRITILVGTEAASPTAPTLTQTEGTLWEVSLAQVRITTAGVITVTDERSPSRTPLAHVVTIAEIETIEPDGTSNLIEFENISGEYKHLKLVGQFRLVGVGAKQVVSLQFNDDTDTNYHIQGASGSNVTASAAAAANGLDLDLFFAPGTDATANYAAEAEFWIANYAETTFFKNVWKSGIEMLSAAVADFTSGMTGGMWLKTEPINKITMLVSAGNFLSGTKVTLYGIS